MTELDTRPSAAAEESLSDLGEDARSRGSSSLQVRMPAVWDSMKTQPVEDESVVVIPSVSLSEAVAGSGSLTQAFEERFLFLLLLLRQPRLRMIYVTSTPIDPQIIEYYLALLPGVIPSHALARLTLLSVDDSSAAAAEREAARAAAAAGEDRRADPEPSALSTSSPTTRPRSSGTSR